MNFSSVLLGPPAPRPLQWEKEHSSVGRRMDTEDRLPGAEVQACYFYCATLGMFSPSLALTCQMVNSVHTSLWGTVPTLKRGSEPSVGKERPVMGL